jgi:hypothetical protein
MMLPTHTRFPIAFAVLASMAGCTTFTPAPQAASRASLEQELAESRAQLSRYESRYGKLLPERPAHDFRKLRGQLNGKPGNAVTALLGMPDKVYSLGATESWDYANAAYDPVSGRTVRTLEVWFRSGVVEYLKALY